MSFLRRCVVRLVGLGFAPGPVQDTVQNDSLLMAQELCRGGSLRDLVAEQMVCRREVREAPIPAEPPISCPAAAVWLWSPLAVDGWPPCKLVPAAAETIECAGAAPTTVLQAALQVPRCENAWCPTGG